MARKVQAVDILPPPDEEGSSSSTDDEQHALQPQKSHEQEEESDEETEPEPVVNKPSLQQPHESEESDETRNSPSAFIVPRPLSKSPEPKASISKSTRVKYRAKRPAESEEFDKASNPLLKNKKSKVSESAGKVEKGSMSKKVVSGEIEQKKSIIKWSEKDEIVLLGGIIEYKSETGDDVNSKMDAFYEYMKGLISVNLTKNQLYEKIKRLKKKFQTNAENLQNGEEPVFSRPHENKLFELSLKIWGTERTVTDGNDSKVKSSKKKDKKDGIVVSHTNSSTRQKSVTNKELFVKEDIKDTILEDKKEETRDYWLLYPRLCASLESEASGYLTVMIRNIKEHVKEIISGMEKEKARELEDGWKAIHLMDAQLYAKRAHLISKQAEAVSDSLNIDRESLHG